MANVKCTHCGLIFDESAMIIEEQNGEKLYFCCHGCEGIYHLLGSEGLDSFYAKLGNTTLSPPSNTMQDDLDKFDIEGFHKKYVTTKDNGTKEINLIIGKIHCSACVWLNEKVLRKTDGVLEATINYTNNKAKIIWDSDTIKLSQIIQTIRAIGYDAQPYDPKTQEEQAIKQRREYYSRILVAVFGMMNIMWIAIAQYAGYFTGIEQKFKDILNVAEFILATPVLFYSGWVFFRGAYYGFKNRTVNMDTLVSLGATSAYIYSIYAMISGHGEVYFDSVVMIITFVLVGKYLEVLSKKQAVDTLDSITSSIPTEVLRITNDTKELIAVENVKVGDVLELKAGEKVVCDGTLTVGSGMFDESSLSGESRPVFKNIGDTILGGTICTDTLVHYQITKDASNSMLYSIVSLLEDSIMKKPRIEQLADSISGYFSVVILLIAIATFGGWYLYDGDFEKALIISISVVVIACPCALGLATPMSTLVGISLAAKRGILFKEASFLETMAKATTIAIDKTGTLTYGTLRIAHEEYYTNDANNTGLIYSLASSSNHPISKAIKNHLEQQNPKIQKVSLENQKTIQGRGIEATYNNKTIYGGNDIFIRDHGIDIAQEATYSIFYVAIDDTLIAKFDLKDKIKPESKETMEALQQSGLKTIMLTGDNKTSALNVSREAGIKDFQYNMLPQDKALYIDKLHEQKEIVIMAGDGINDSIALAKSDIAISMGGGAEVAIDVSDVVILDDNILKIKEAHQISKRTYRAIKENLGFSVLYNIIAIPLAASGFVYPLVSALSMSLSSLIVVGNAVRIKNLKFKKENE